MERHPVFCLLCNTRQMAIHSHLKVVCMKGSSPEEIKTEAARATASQKAFAKDGRLWDFSELQGYCKDEESCIRLCNRLQSRGFLVTNAPQACQTDQPASRSTTEDVLAFAKKDVGYIHQKIVKGEFVSHTAGTTLRYYCEAILLLEHKLPRMAVMELCVQDWVNRRHIANGVTVELSSTHRPETFTLTKEQEEIFESYFRSIRPLFIHKSGQRNDMGKFFVTESGAPLSNPSSDLKRLKLKYLPLDQEEARAATSPQAGQSTEEQASAMPQSAHKTPLLDWDAFRQQFPVTLTDEPPSKKRISEAGFPVSRKLSHRWRYRQRQERIKYVLTRSTNRKGKAPLKSRIQAVLDKETTWEGNKPTCKEVLAAWVPPKQNTEEEKNKSQARAITEQDWRGLTVKDFGMAKGKGVVAAIPFSKGDIICDYHGETITEAEGKKRQQSGYLFFFKAEGGAGLCIDATAPHCECHPEMQTFGRLLNHSRKNPNVAPRRTLVDFPGGPQEVILFVALKTINIGDQLVWDCGEAHY
ncbi:uncharacterized protein LOC114428908 [Parambassis ranga]|uniref:Uncharacterized protein LOC114428737 n=1 Tax=Parambassis ranga TaxID=210632 RepID=A0A6P7HY98_9TELE|nr:uncharacterized protein LOC114428737 [Parambassis ranga]XP_028253484.1 uncharacterized protein LOC114428905 [Parambassis ranga]XP_028253489.1 uncharacterized protein LOC114428908 [Parambassis ranga]